MKLSDYVAGFLSAQGIRHVFAITGGASLHLIDSISRHPGLEYICPHHEQAGAMAADAYARVTGNLGAALATSGPGGTNMVTGIAGAYYDSVPVLYVTGQVSTFRFKGDTGSRQIGFQETDIAAICAPITKYAVTVTDPLRIRYELEKAVWLAREGRPGPVLVDIPDNLQRHQIEPETLGGFAPPVSARPAADADLAAAVRQCLYWLAAAERPLVVLGWGVRLAGAEREALAFVERLGLPVNLTWGAADLMAEDHPLRVGTFGTHGTRFGNFAIQNADLMISIGSRLDTHMIGSPFSTFCRGGRKVIVDIDGAENGKFPQYGLNVDLPVTADARDFLAEALRQSEGRTPADLSPWKARIAGWKERYRAVRPEYAASNSINPYVFVQALSDAMVENDVMIADTGCSVAWLGQAFRFKTGQRYFSAFNNTPMGYALPASIGAALALGGGKRIVCVTGDGGLMMNLQELCTVIHHRLPVKVIVLNNHGYSMIQQTQDQWLESRYEASAAASLGFPDFQRLGETLGFPTVTLLSHDDVANGLKAFLDAPGPGFCNLELRPEERVIPQVKFGRPIEDPEPLLERREFLDNMLIPPLEVSM